MQPIAFIQTDFKEKFGIPRQSGRAPSALGKIVFYPEYRNSDALRGIEGFSHLWILFDFSLCKTQKFSPTVRPPRLGGNERVGVFASRAPFRPNGIGLSCVKLLTVEQSQSDGDVLMVSGVDMLDGTPIYDIKPYIPATDCIKDATGGFSEKFTDYKLNVIFPPHLLSKIPQNKRAALSECIADDPRPSYHEDGRIYGMNFAEFNVCFTVSGDTLTVTEITAK